jgi:hypothetical protein
LVDNLQTKQLLNLKGVNVSKLLPNQPLDARQSNGFGETQLHKLLRCGTHDAFGLANRLPALIFDVEDAGQAGAASVVEPACIA